MSRFNQRFFAKLDAAAEYTGMPAIARQDIRRRHFRWLPILVLAFAIGGWIWGLARPESATLAYVAINVGFVIGIWLPLFGPIKPWGGPKLADEFDRQVRQRAFLYGFATITFTAYLGIWVLIGLAAIDRWTTLQLIDQLRNFAHMLFVLYLAVPTLQASWAMRPVAED